MIQIIFWIQKNPGFLEAPIDGSLCSMNASSLQNKNTINIFAK